MAIREYLQYVKNNKDDSPLYCFDRRFAREEASKAMLDDFEVPKLFTEDLFDLLVR